MKKIEIDKVNNEVLLEIIQNTEDEIINSNLDYLDILRELESIKNIKNKKNIKKIINK